MPQMQDQLLLRQAEQAVQERRFVEAETLCQQLLKKDRRNTSALSMLARVATERGTFPEAVRLLQRCIAQRPREHTFQVNLGFVRVREGRYDRAIRHYERALKIKPDDGQALAGIARAFELSGDRERARDTIKSAIEAGADDPQLAAVLARIEYNDGNYEECVTVATGCLARADAAASVRTSLFSTVGKAYERLGRYDDAFAAYDSRSREIEVRFDPQWLVRFNDSLIETFSTERLAKMSRAEQPSELPIYVVGMPRSGSTLIETIIDAHPQAHAGGEMNLVIQVVGQLPLELAARSLYPECLLEMQREQANRIGKDYLEQLTRVAPKADRIVDKFLGNYRHLGLLSLLVPKARVIHSLRDPLDTCLSCFAEDLSPKLHPYASSLDYLGIVYREYRRLMDHYKEVLSIAWLDLQYEELVADQEAVSRRIIDFCGLEWDDACLQYHDTGRQVGTISYDQVRQPIYNRSVGRAQRFGDHLKPLVEALDQSAGSA